MCHSLCVASMSCVSKCFVRVLGLDDSIENACDEELIRSSWRRSCLYIHPDKVPFELRVGSRSEAIERAAHEAQILLNLARDVLVCRGKRQLYLKYGIVRGDVAHVCADYARALDYCQWVRTGFAVGSTPDWAAADDCSRQQQPQRSGPVCEIIDLTMDSTDSDNDGCDDGDVRRSQSSFSRESVDMYCSESMLPEVNEEEEHQARSGQHTAARGASYDSESPIIKIEEEGGAGAAGRVDADVRGRYCQRTKSRRRAPSSGGVSALFVRRRASTGLSGPSGSSPLSSSKGSSGSASASPVGPSRLGASVSGPGSDSQRRRQQQQQGSSSASSSSASSSLPGPGTRVCSFCNGTGYRCYRGRRLLKKPFEPVGYQLLGCKVLSSKQRTRRTDFLVSWNGKPGATSWLKEPDAVRYFRSSVIEYLGHIKKARPRRWLYLKQFGTEVSALCR